MFTSTDTAPEFTLLSFPLEPNANPPLALPNSEYSLAFPSLATNLCFPIQHALPIAVKCIADFLESYPNVHSLRLYLVDGHIDTNANVDVSNKKSIPRLSTDTLEAWRKYVYHNETGDRDAAFIANDFRFQIIYGDITQPLTNIPSFPSAQIVNVTDFRFSGKGELFRSHVNAACNNLLPQLSIAKHSVGKLGEAFIVELPTSSSNVSSSTYVGSEVQDLGTSTAKEDDLSTFKLNTQGVRRVIQVIAPNLNPKRLDYIDTLNEATDLLTQSYKNMFAKFAECSRLSQPGFGGFFGSYKPATRSRSLSTVTKEPEAEIKPFITTLLPSSTDFMYDPPDETASVPHSFGPPLDALKAYLRNPVPSQLRSFIYYEDTDFVVTYDRYWKAAFHLLVLPRNTSKNSIKELDVHDIPMLKKLLVLAKRIVSNLQSQAKQQSLDSLGFRAGFHSVPSMKHLHCHIISQDFQSSFLKSKKHFNSFATPFFLSLGRIIEELSAHGQLRNLPLEEMLKAPMKCHHIGCKNNLRIIPVVRDHLANCTFPQPTDKEFND